MSALSEALPLSLSAAFYPPAILVLILLLASERPRRLVFTYLAGASLIVVACGVAFLGLLAGDDPAGRPVGERGRGDRARRPAAGVRRVGVGAT